MALTQLVVREPAELAAHEPAWWELLARSEDSEPTLTPFWLRSWWRVFGGEGGRRLRVWLMFDAGRLVGFAPLLARRHWYAPGLPFRRLELLGSGEAEADEICSEYLGVVSERGREAEVLNAFAGALASKRLGGWDEALFPALRGGNQSGRLLAQALERAGFAVETTVKADCPYIALPATWDDYLAALGSSARSFVKRSAASFEQWANGQAEFHAARTQAELEHGSAVLRSLHGERWSAAGGPGVFASAKFKSFHEQVMRAMLELGSLELGWLSVRDEPIAALYNYSWNGRVYFYQSGRKLDLPSAIRPGIVAHLFAIRRAIEAGRREYDFLGGASQYKLKLATGARQLLCLRAVRSPRLERARGVAERGVDVLRRLRGRVGATSSGSLARE